MAARLNEIARAVVAHVWIFVRIAIVELLSKRSYDHCVMVGPGEDRSNELVDVQ